MLNGIDISAWQAGIDLTAVPSDFVIIKATEGLSYVSDDCDRAVQQCIATGKKIGVYHFANGDSSGTAEADFFVDQCAGYIGKAIFVLDWEADAVSAGPGYAKEFLDRVYARTGYKPMIYMSGSVCNEWNWSDVVAADYALWCAYYTQDNCGYVPDAASYPQNYWPDAAILQYTSGGILSGWGDRLDLNVFYGDAAAWDKYISGSTPEPTPTPTPAESCKTAPWGVDTIQYFVRICNYCPGIEIDGLDGPITQSGVKNSQTAYGITADGLFGTQTQARAEGQVYQYEEKLQALGFYHGALDYIPGPALFGAVQEFQTAHGLEADGVVGTNTFAALFA